VIEGIMIIVRQAQPKDADWMQTSFDQRMGWTKPAGYFQNACDLQIENKIVLLVAVDGDQYAGHTKVAWSPDYPYFRDNSIPEIQDLNVLPVYRRQGVATSLVDAAENLIRQRSKIAGIGVGLYADYGPAQRMYVQRGYVPDGKGVAYHDHYVTPGASVPVDDDLVLFFVKEL
jgi:GNAT superfamily N-acetyltransferase